MKKILLLGFGVFVATGVLVFAFAIRTTSRVTHADGELVSFREPALVQAEVFSRNDCPALVVREGCSACARAKAWLNETGRCFVEVEIDAVQGRRLAKSQGFVFVPTLILPNGFIEGFYSEAWAANYPHPTN